MRHTLATLAIFGLTACGVAAGTTTVAPTPAEAGCARNEEAQAFDIRALKSSLMVAALSCGQQDYYNTFIKRHESVISDGGNTIKAYFEKNYGGGADRELTRFVTTLANKAAKGSMQSDDVRYCQETAEMFGILLQIDPPELANVAGQDRYTALHEFGDCS